MCWGAVQLPQGERGVSELEVLVGVCKKRGRGRECRMSVGLPEAARFVAPGRQLLRLCHLLASQFPAKHQPESPTPLPPQLMADAPHPKAGTCLCNSTLSFRFGEGEEGGAQLTPICALEWQPPPHFNQAQNVKISPAPPQQPVGLLPPRAPPPV